MLKTASLALVLALTTVLAVFPADAEPDNGVIMMVHLHFEPWVNEASPLFVPPAAEAVGGTLEGGQILVHAIPFGTGDALPVVVDDAKLRVLDASGAEVFMVAPNLDPAEQRICVEETNLPGHEGHIAACKAFAIDAEALNGVDVWTLELTFEKDGREGRENYNVVAHYLIHSYIESGGESMPLTEADATFNERTPVVAQSLVDPVA